MIPSFNSVYSFLLLLLLLLLLLFVCFFNFILILILGAPKVPTCLTPEQSNGEIRQTSENNHRCKIFNHDLHVRKKCLSVTSDNT